MGDSKLYRLRLSKFPMGLSPIRSIAIFALSRNCLLRQLSGPISSHCFFISTSAPATSRVLTNDTNYFSAELNLVQAQLNERLSLVQLYQALGGGWQQ